MTDILFTANGASATALVSGELTSGMVGLPVRFSFDSDWDGLNIVAVFDGGGQRISVPLLTDMEAVLPWEVIAKANTRLRIGAEGRKSDGSVVIPTVWANAGYITEGAVATDEEGNPPTPGIYDQIMAAINAGKLQGAPGEDGVSPVVDVVDIEGGHRVTITDKNGTQVFDVMNGKDGSDASVSIVDNLGSSDPNAALSARMGSVLKAKVEDDVSALNKQLQPQINQRVKTVNGIAPDENGDVNVEGGTGIYIGSTQPTDGSLYWLDTSDGVNDEPVKYTVSAILENVTIDNTAESVNEGASFAATLTVGDDYVIQEVSVTMGGVDVTSVAYVGDSIYIGSVVGDIVITAKAIARADTGTVWSITNNLSNVTSNNTALSVSDGDAYTATLTWGSGYKIDSVTITMGGEDVTTTVYADGVISIGSVTGDVVITATAVVKAPYLDDESNIYATSETSVGLYINYADAIAKFPSDNIYLYFKAPDAYKTKINTFACNDQQAKLTNATAVENAIGVAHYDHRKESGYVVQVLSLSKIKAYWDEKVASGTVSGELVRFYFQVPVTTCLPLKVLYNYAE